MKKIDILIKLVKENDVPFERYTNLIRTNPIIQNKIFISCLKESKEIKEKMKNICIELLELTKIVEDAKYKSFEELSADDLTEQLIEIVEKVINNGNSNNTK